MEKYRKFADPGTGVNPFVPAHLYSSNVDSMLGKTIRGLIYTPLAIVRIAIVAVILVIVSVTDILYMVPLISSLLVRPFLRPVSCWILALCCGVVCPFSSETVDFRRLKMRRPVDETSGEVVVTDFHGFMDVLVHAVGTRPSAFVFPTGDGKLVVCWSVLRALQVCLCLPVLPIGESANIPRNALLFICTVPTNGLGVLTCNSFLPKSKSTSISVINYVHRGCFGAHHLVGSVWTHLASLMTKNWYVVAQLKATPGCVDYMQQGPAIMARLYPACVVTELDGSAFGEFQRYWLETQTLKYPQ